MGGVELDPVAALIFDLLHALLQLQLKPLLALLFLLPQFLLAGSLSCGQFRLQVLLLVLRVPLQRNVVISGCPQILAAAVDFFLQVDYFGISLVDNAEGFFELIMVTPELKGESVAVEMFFSLRLVDFILSSPKKYDESMIDVREVVLFLSVDPQRGCHGLRGRSFVEFPGSGGVEGLQSGVHVPSAKLNFITK